MDTSKKLSDYKLRQLRKRKRVLEKNEALPTSSPTSSDIEFPESDVDTDIELLDSNIEQSFMDSFMESLHNDESDSYTISDISSNIHSEANDSDESGEMSIAPIQITTILTKMILMTPLPC